MQPVLVVCAKSTAKIVRTVCTVWVGLKSRGSAAVKHSRRDKKYMLPMHANLPRSLRMVGVNNTHTGKHA